MELTVTGNPTPEELAAVLVLLAAGGGTDDAGPEPTAPSRWNDRASVLRRPLQHGPGAWRAAL